MPAPRSRRRARLASLVSVALAVTGFQFFLAAPAAQANPLGTDLVIKEVYGGGGATTGSPSFKYDYVELYNPTSTARSVDGLSLQYRSATYAPPGSSVSVLALPNETVPANGHYLVQVSGAGTVGADLPVTPDHIDTALNMSGTNGQVLLVTGTAPITATGNLVGVANVVDAVGYGTTPTSFETARTGTALTTTTSASRNATGGDTDSNLADFTAGAPTPTAAGPSPLALTNPGPQTDTVGQPIATLQLSATGGSGTKTYGATDLPAGLSINTSTGAITGTPTTVESPNVTVSVSDTSGSDSEQFTWTITAAPTGPIPVADIQGTTGVSPLDGDTVTTEGAVTGVYPNGGFNGFYLQTPGPDTTPGASDGLFVFTPTFDDSTLALGDSVEVTGEVSEFGTAPNTLTEITATTVADIAPLGAVVANATVPGSDCTLGSCPDANALNMAKEEFEGELFQPAGDYTVTDAYDGSAYNGSASSSFFGEIGLAANSDTPLYTPTELVDAQNTAGIAARTAYNNAHRLILDDGSSTTYWNTAGTGQMNSTIPWYTTSHQVRVGAAVTFPAPVVLDYRFGWKVQPQTQVVGAPTAGEDPQFEQDRPATPEDVGGDLKLATFNVLNYFTTLGVDYDAGPGTCSAFNDKDGNPIAVNSCSGDGPRGAWNATSFNRQQEKIVDAINTMDADIVSLEEIENSRKVDDSPNRDEAVGALVAALNADAGTTRWAFVPSPPEAELPTEAEEDVIRTAFIYNPATVDLVGGSKILTGVAAFNNAREPLAQAFKAEGDQDADGFAVIVNHFKSKGSGADDGTGQGLANPDRIAQANALKTFANTFAGQRGVEAVFLTGDFNAYSMEDPIQVFTNDQANPWTSLESTDDPEEESYSFDGQSGSLDHVIANAEANAMVTGVDIWEINANETVFNQYSRYNYVTPLLYQPGPFSASDHNPEVIGIDVPDSTLQKIQILGTNDFHGRIANDAASAAAGAGVLAGAVKQLRASNPNTVFAAAGDLIGASTFESFILKDKPTIDALNEAGLEVSAAGNHEFDQGYADLVDRVMAPYDETTNPFGGAEWEYIAANVRLDEDDSHALAPTWTQEFGNTKVGFVGAVTEHLPELVSPGGIQEIYVTDVVDEVNDAAEDLKADGADIVVMLVHEGAPNTNCATMDDDPTSDFGSIINGVSDDVDAIVSGHTHLEYNCSFPVPGWAGRDVTERPVVSAGQYGAALNRIVFTVDSTTGEVVAKSQSVLKLKSCANSTACTNYPTDGPTQVIVDDALAEAAILGAQPLGQIAGPIRRGYLANGTTENRGVESSLGNLVAEAQRWQTSGVEAGSAQIAFMNPGGLRTDMLGLGAVGDPYPRTLTYKQAAEVQPFANGLVNMDLTGAQIKAALEQQWQPVGASRPFLKLGASKGFTYTSDPDAAQGSRITGMWLDGVPINPATVYSVTVNSFLSTGGDNFGAFAGGTNKAEAGLTDLQAMVNFMDEFANTGEGDPPLPVPTKQNGVHVNFPAGAPADYEGGDTVAFEVSGWSFSNAGDPKDTEVVVKLGAATLGSATLDNTIQAALPGFDGTGTASVSVTLPAVLPDGTANLHLTGATTGTDIIVPIAVDDGLPDTTVSADDVTATVGQAAEVDVTVTPPDADGTVEVRDGATVLGTATLAGGSATVTIPANQLPAAGEHELTVAYLGEPGAYSPSTGTFTLTVGKAASTTAAPNVTVTYGQPVPVQVTVTGAGPTPTGDVTLLDGATELGTATLGADGKATIMVPAKTLPAGSKTLTVVYDGDGSHLGSQTTLTVTTTKAASSVSAPDGLAVEYGNALAVTVNVGAPAGITPTGTVTVRNGGTSLGTGTVSGGVATVILPARSLPPGTGNLTAEYGGDANLTGATDAFAVTVSKAGSTTEAKVKPGNPTPKKKVKLVVKVEGDNGVEATGKVKITVAGETITKSLKDGKLKVNLGKFDEGEYKVKVVYLGSDTVEESKDKVTFEVD